MIKDRFWLIALFFIGIFFYVLTLKGIPGNPPGKLIKNNLDQATKPFELSPERDRYILVQSLAENKSFALSQELADAAYPDVGYYKGRFYIFFAPGISLFALPMYLIGKYVNLAQVFSYFLISLFASANLIFLYKISKDIFKLPLWTSLMAALIFAFASTSWSYAVTLYQHHVTTFFIISSFYGVWKYKQRSRNSWLWGVYIWTAYALAILIDYPNAILMLPVMVYFLIASLHVAVKRHSVTILFRMAFIVTSILFIIITLLHGYYNYTNFGDWKRVSGSLVGYKVIKERNLFAQQSGQTQISTLAENKVPIKFFREDSFVRGVQALLISQDRGIFFYTPIFILSLFGIFYMLRRPTLESGVLLSVIACDLFLYSSFGDPWGGWAFGPRYLIPSMAVLSLAIAVWLSKTQYVLFSKIITFLLFAPSVAISLAGVLTTNAVPPKIEADYLKTYYNYILNFQYLLNGRSSSFIFNQYFSHNINLIAYYLVILELILTVTYVVLFIIPQFKKYEY